MEINFYKKNTRTYQRYLLILLVSCGIASKGFSQEDPTNRQYLFNILNINPAYAGTRDGINITAGFKKQWAGIPGAPQTTVFSMDAPLKEHHFGVGMQLYTNSLGLERTTGLNMSFSTSLLFEEDAFLALGLQAGLMNYKIDRTSVALPFQSDAAFQTNTNVMLPTAGIGLYYQRPGFFASLSAPSLLVSTVKVDKLISLNSASLKNMQIVLNTGISADVSDDIQVKPSFYMRYMSGKVFDVHANASVWLKNLVGIGVSYRFDDSVLGILELKAGDKLSFGYSYGKNIGNKDIFSQGTHEAIIRLNLARSEE